MKVFAKIYAIAFAALGFTTVGCFNKYEPLQRQPYVCISVTVVDKADGMHLRNDDGELILCHLKRLNRCQ